MQAPKWRRQTLINKNGTKQMVGPCLAPGWQRSSLAGWRWLSLVTCGLALFKGTQFIANFGTPDMRNWRHRWVLGSIAWFNIDPADWQSIICKQQGRLRSEAWQQLHFQILLQHRKTPCAVHHTEESREQKISKLCSKKEKCRRAGLALIYYWLISS